MNGRTKKVVREGHFALYLIMLPSFIVLFIFRYIPLYGLIVAFQDYNVFGGIFNSKFVGMKHFCDAFSNPDFLRVLANTLIINSTKLLFWVPLPLFFAIAIDEIRPGFFRRCAQTIIYLPHFLSWVIVGGIFSTILAVNGGVVNRVITALGMPSVPFMMNGHLFRGVLISSAMWKEVGWGTIVYLASITALDPQLFEAATIDGASKMQRIRHITLPGLANTVILVLLMSLGGILTNSFEQIIVMYNVAVYDAADVVNTYVYRYGIGKMQYSYATAVGIFNSVVGFSLVLSTNMLCRRFLDRSLW